VRELGVELPSQRGPWAERGVEVGVELPSQRGAWAERGVELPSKRGVWAERRLELDGEAETLLPSAWKSDGLWKMMEDISAEVGEAEGDASEGETTAKGLSLLLPELSSLKRKSSSLSRPLPGLPSELTSLALPKIFLVTGSVLDPITAPHSLTGVLGRGGGGLGSVTSPLSRIQVPTLSMGRHLLQHPEERQEGQLETLLEQDVQQGCPLEQKSGWWKCPTIMLRQTGHSISAKTRAFREVSTQVLIETGDPSSAVQYREESKLEDDSSWSEQFIFLLNFHPPICLNLLQH